MIGMCHDGYDTLMVTPDVGEESSKKSLIDFKLLLNPLDRPDKDIILHACVQPLKIVYDEVIEWVWSIYLLYLCRTLLMVL